jgi:hypothetical protein
MDDTERHQRAMADQPRDLTAPAFPAAYLALSTASAGRLLPLADARDWTSIFSVTPRTSQRGIRRPVFLELHRRNVLWQNPQVSVISPVPLASERDDSDWEAVNEREPFGDHGCIREPRHVGQACDESRDRARDADADRIDAPSAGLVEKGCDDFIQVVEIERRVLANDLRFRCSRPGGRVRPGLRPADVRRENHEPRSSAFAADNERIVT